MLAKRHRSKQWGKERLLNNKLLFVLFKISLHFLYAKLFLKSLTYPDAFPEARRCFASPVSSKRGVADGTAIALIKKLSFVPIVENICGSAFLETNCVLLNGIRPLRILREKELT